MRIFSLKRKQRTKIKKEISSASKKKLTITLPLNWESDVHRKQNISRAFKDLPLGGAKLNV